jgi:hypothetical protein
MRMLRFDVRPQLWTQKAFERRYAVDSMPAVYGKVLFCRSLRWQDCGRTRYAIGLRLSGVRALSALLQIALEKRLQTQTQVV